MRVAVLAATSLMISACATEPLVFPEWTIPVPEGTPIIEYPAVPMEERTEQIELVEDLVIGQRGDDPNYVFYQPWHVVADSEGRIFVMDRRSNRIQVFDSAGEYLMSLGQRGQGPGEFSGLSGLALAGDKVFAVDNRSARFTVFGPAGDLLATFPKDRAIGTVRRLMGSDGGSIVAMRQEEDPSNLLINRYALLRLSDEMAPLDEVVRFPDFLGGMVSRRSVGADASPMTAMVSISLPYPYPRAVTATDGEIYATFTSEYQVFAFGSDGQMIWALRVPWKREPITEKEIEATLAFIHSIPSWEDFDRSEHDWPQLRPAIDRIAVDGVGNLLVILHSGPGEEDSDERMVDVYSPAGEHLFSGWIPDIDWDSARGKFVYDIRSDDETGDQSVVRYRLVEPF